MVSSNWAALTDGLSPEDQALLERYRDTVLALDDADSRSAKDDAPHPGRIEERVHATAKVITHRLDATTAAEIDSLVALLREARDTVGPGTR